MKDVFDYISSNSFFTTIIGVIIGWVLTFVSTLYFHKREEKQRKKENERLEKQKRFENKPELYIEKNANKDNVDIEIFLGTFNVVYNENRDYDIVYSDNICDKKKHKFKDVIIKNVGKSDIECLNIVITNKRSTILTSYDFLDTLVANKSVWYDCCYDKKIRTGEEIKLRIYFEEGHQPYNLFSSTLAFLFEDQHHNFWEQPFFYEKDNIYSPYAISYADYRRSITVDDAYDCFEHPWMW